MSYPNPGSLVETDWLAAHLDAPDIRIIDATWYLPDSAGSARVDYEAQHIPGALFFDIDAIARQDTDLPHMLPEPEQFAAHMKRLGLGDGFRFIVYDRYGLMTAARVWWSFHVFGHQDIAILNGGLPKWLSENHPVTDQPSLPSKRHFTPRQNNLWVRNIEQIRRIVENGCEQLVDARSAGRFSGLEAEIWPGRHQGHIPGSLNLPFTRLLNPTNKTLLPTDRLQAEFAAAGVKLDRPVIASCGSGVTACVLAFALNLLGHNQVSVYDGSWAEWGLPDESIRPIETHISSN